MIDPDSDRQRPIGFTGLVRWVMVVAAAIGVGAAFSEGYLALGAIGLLFVVMATILGVRAAQARRDAGGSR